MAKRKLKNSGRPKAPFGIGESAAILTAAGINAATQLTAAGMNAAAQAKAAKQQADATVSSANTQADAIRRQTERSQEYQQNSQDFIREQNEENRQIQKDIQMQLQMLTGQQNVNDRLEAGKIKVKYGGNKNRKLRSAGAYIPLQGNNMPFKVTDGGGVIPISTTPQGYDLYEIYGNDHDHYHKAQGGKHKSGVGIKFADGVTIEGEGNQNSNTGEKMLVTPDNAYFISKHSIKGFNPAKSVDEGMDPMEAYAIQELIKQKYNLKDDGSSPVKKSMGGLVLMPDAFYSQITPAMDTDIIGSAANGIAYGKRKLRCGGSMRRKAPNGTMWRGSFLPLDLTLPNYSNYTPGSPNVSPVPVNNIYTGDYKFKSPSNTSRYNKNYELIGAGITGLGNFGGALITSLGNRSSAKTLSNAYNKSAGILADAYRSLKTIDTDAIKREDYAASHAMAALQAPVSQAEAQIAGVNRQLQRRLSNAGRYSASSAAAQARMANAEIEAQDNRNKIYSTDQQQMQQIRQANAERATQTAIANAQMDTEANKQYGQAYLNMLQYNNDIENEKILGAANALSEGNLNSVGVIADARRANHEAWASALAQTGLGFGAAYNAMGTRRANRQNVLAGVPTIDKVMSAVSSGDKETARNLYASVYNAYYNEAVSPAVKRQYANYLAMLQPYV